MSHPEIAEWADYARELVSDGERSAMERHLDESCGSCQTTLSAVERVASAARADSTAPPPAAAVRSVKAFFAAQHPRAFGHWNELRLRSIFDSSPAPAASGGKDYENRQLLYESDRYTLELSFEFPRGPFDPVLRGQLLEAHGEPRSHTPVFLVGKGDVIGRAISEQHGTFEISGHVGDTSELWVFPDDENRIRLSLKPEN